MTAYDLIATDDGHLTNGARRHFNSQPVATASMILMTGLHLIGAYRIGATRSRYRSPRIGGC